MFFKDIIFLLSNILLNVIYNQFIQFLIQQQQKKIFTQIHHNFIGDYD